MFKHKKIYVCSLIILIYLNNNNNITYNYKNILLKNTHLIQFNYILMI